MSLPAKLHDLRLALDQFRFADISPDEEQRICNAAAKLTSLLDQCSSRAPPINSAESDAETLLTIARQYGVRVSDLRHHNPHLQHFDDSEPLPRNTPVKVKATKSRGRSNDGVAQIPADHTSRKVASDSKFAFDTIRSIAKDQNVTIEALMSANKILSRFDVDEPLPQDLDIVVPTNVEPAQRTYVLTFAGESIRIIADTVAHCRPEELIAVNPQLGNVGIDTRLPEGTRIALAR